MNHSQQQLRDIIEKNRYNNTPLEQGEGHKPITVGLFALEMFKMMQEKEKQLEDMRKELTMMKLALSSYKESEKDDIIAELTRVIVGQLDYRMIKSQHPFLKNLLEKKAEALTSTDGTYEGETIHGVANGKGTFKLSDGGSYTGETVAGHMHGHGKLDFSNGNHYEGEFKNGFATGAGVLKYANGDTYNGNLKNGHKHGLGVIRTAGGDLQIGFFENDKNHGLCVQLTADKQHVAVENYMNDKKEGMWLLYKLQDKKQYKNDEIVTS